MPETSELVPGQRRPVEDDRHENCVPVQEHQVILAALENITKDRDAWRHAATHDDLTGLLNQRAWEDEVNLRLESGESLAVLAFDIDHFKLVNDRYGHAYGDQLLVYWADYMRLRFRREDDMLTARRSGDEFSAAISLELPDSDFADREADLVTRLLNVAHYAQDCVREFESLLPAELRELGVSISIGLAASTPFNQRNLADLLASADGAMYQNKREVSLLLEKAPPLRPLALEPLQ